MQSGGLRRARALFHFQFTLFFSLHNQKMKHSYKARDSLPNGSGPRPITTHRHADSPLRSLQVLLQRPPSARPRLYLHVPHRSPRPPEHLRPTIPGRTTTSRDPTNRSTCSNSKCRYVLHVLSIASNRRPVSDFRPDPTSASQPPKPPICLATSRSPVLCCAPQTTPSEQPWRRNRPTPPHAIFISAPPGRSLKLHEMLPRRTQHRPSSEFAPRSPEIAPTAVATHLIYPVPSITATT